MEWTECGTGSRHFMYLNEKNEQISVYKEISKFNKKKATNPIKNDPDFKRHFTKDMLGHYAMKNIQQLLITREMPTKLQW